MGDPAQEQTVVEVARQAADAVRLLNHMTRTTSVGLPSDVYSVLGELSLLAGRLPQLLVQLDGLVQGWAAAGELGFDATYAGAPLTAVTTVGTALREEGVAAARSLAEAVDMAAQVMACATFTGPLPDEA